MGFDKWDEIAYVAKEEVRARTGETAFKYDSDIKSGVIRAGIHETLNPFGVINRESCDSAAFPEALPIVIALDQTGSMARVIKQIQKSLINLMRLLIGKGYAPYPHILISAYGDANEGETAPLQVGQFESDIRIEENLTNLYIEGGGGGGMQETPEYIAYIISRHTKTDSWEKRKKKGYMFIIGDELNYPAVYKKNVKKLIGDDLQADIPVDVIYKELAEKWEVFFILPKGASHGGSSIVKKHWAELVGAQHVLELEDANACAELIATQIGIYEDTVDIEVAKKDLKDIGLSESSINAVTKAVAIVPSSGYTGGVVKVSSTELKPSTENDSIERL